MTRADILGVTENGMEYVRGGLSASHFSLSKIIKAKVEILRISPFFIFHFLFPFSPSRRIHIRLRSEKRKFPHQTPSLEAWAALSLLMY